MTDGSCETGSATGSAAAAEVPLNTSTIASDRAHAARRPTVMGPPHRTAGPTPTAVRPNAEVTCGARDSVDRTAQRQHHPQDVLDGARERGTPQLVAGLEVAG